MSAKELPDLHRLKDLFYVDTTSPSSLRWNVSLGRRVVAGAVAGCLMQDGYWAVCISGLTYKCHRIVICNNKRDNGVFGIRS